MSDRENEELEIRSLAEAIYLKYGCDFRGYARDFFKRRIKTILKERKIEHISHMKHRIINDKAFFLWLLSKLTVNVTQMFRDPGFYQKLRENVLPMFKEHPFIRVWIAGCSTGEEAYSIAIVLKEEGLYNSSQIYATDISVSVLETAKQAIYPAGLLKEYTDNYRKSAGKRSFSDYYTAKYDHAIMDKTLRDKITFANHNLAADSSFGIMDMIFCRNVFIYFTRPLQSRVLGLFSESLNPGGILCLAPWESIMFLENANQYFEELYPKEKIYKKK